jgi:predicted nuclease of restriction endonuclease-like (RecB) superfamily
MPDHMPTKKKALTRTSEAASPAVFDAALVADVRQIILDARQTVAQAVDSGHVLMNWSIGTRIRKDILKEQRAEYGKRIVSALGRQLSQEFGGGYSDKNLRHMVRFVEAFPDIQIVSALLRQLSWTHFKTIIYLSDPLKRDFYAEMCRIERWNTRTLQDKVDSMLYERTALSKKPEVLIRQELKALRSEDRMTPDLVFRDPCILDFLGLKDTYAEKDLEAAILREMEGFILELGTGFAFVARQKRMTIDNEDHSLDLLFYHRGLRRLVAIELKLGEFKAAYKGQMELYLAWLDRYERSQGEEKPIGLILCAGKKQETIELLNMEKDGIRVSSYWTEILPRKQLQKKLHEAVIRARAQIEHRAVTRDKSNPDS